jgi:hypothetical protein
MVGLVVVNGGIRVGGAGKMFSTFVSMFTDNSSIYKDKYIKMMKKAMI